MSHRYLNVDTSNLATEHLCCAFSDPKHAEGVEAKRTWLRARLAEGLVFRKLDARAKVFIEYMPGETCWRPIHAPGWMVIHCLWVSGRYAGQGHGRTLLEYCKTDTRARSMAGVVVATGRRKRPFLGDPKFFAHHGFERVDRIGEYDLWAWRIDATAKAPRFAEAVRHQDPALGAALVARYTDQCPLNRHWAHEMASFLTEEGHPAQVSPITTCAGAQNVASPLGTFGLESADGLVTHHLQTRSAVRRLIQKRQGKNSQG